MESARYRAIQPIAPSLARKCNRPLDLSETLKQTRISCALHNSRLDRDRAPNRSDRHSGLRDKEIDLDHWYRSHLRQDCSRLLLDCSYGRDQKLA